uniref:Ig-like domain-containing protein n=1 Tax=Oreochromis niloticus TaxID=8128 RepID=A0A669B6F2_ORENI
LLCDKLRFDLSNLSAFFFFILSEHKKITTESGLNVTLPCQASNVSFIAVKWSKADLGKEYVYLNRRGTPQPQEQHPSFSNRVDLQDRQKDEDVSVMDEDVFVMDEDVSVILKNLTINDTGTYECCVFVEDSWKSVGNFTLRVVPPVTAYGVLVLLAVAVFISMVFIYKRLHNTNKVPAQTPPYKGVPTEKK